MIEARKVGAQLIENMYARAREHMRKSERDLTLPVSGGPTRGNMGKLASSQNPVVVALTSNPALSLEKAGALNNTMDTGSLEGPRREEGRNKII